MELVNNLDINEIHVYTEGGTKVLDLERFNLIANMQWLSSFSFASFHSLVETEDSKPIQNYNKTTFIHENNMLVNFNDVPLIVPDDIENINFLIHRHDFRCLNNFRVKMSKNIKNIRIVYFLEDRIKKMASEFGWPLNNDTDKLKNVVKELTSNLPPTIQKITIHNILITVDELKLPYGCQVIYE